MTKIEKICKSLPEGTACLIKDSLNRFYLTGFRSSAGTLVLTPHRAELIIDFRYYEMAKDRVKDCSVTLLSNEREQLSAILGDSSTVFVETDKISVDMFESLQKSLAFAEISTDKFLVRAIENMRIVKSPEELNYLAQCQKITDDAFRYILPQIGEGVSERQLAYKLDMFFRENGASGSSFDTIVLSGPNTSLPHGVPSDRTIESGDFILMDFGVYMNGYCSDMTRTVAYKNVSDEQAYVYQTVLTAQEKVLSQIRAGITGGSADKIAREYIEKDCGFQGKFGHSLGHGVGIEIHEQPTLSPMSQVVLQPGMVVTIEPGIYLQGQFGVRIEDFVSITESGCSNFTKSEKSLIILS